MKLLILFSLIISSLTWANRVELPSKYYEDGEQNKIAEAWVKQTDDNDQEVFKPNDVKLDMLAFTEDLYLEGYVTLESLKDYQCKVDELINIQKINDSISDSNKQNCYGNYLNSFKNSQCRANLTKDDYFKVVKADETEFDKKYECNSIGTNWWENLHNKEKLLYGKLYKEIVKTWLNKQKGKTQFYANEFEMATVKKCKQGTQKRAFAGYKAVGSCTTKQKECSEHSDCCSKSCIKKDDETVGRCESELSCYIPIAKGKSCGEIAPGIIHPYCKNRTSDYVDAIFAWADNPDASEANKPREPDNSVNDISCIATNYNRSEIGACVEDGDSAKSAIECCSDKIENGKCVANFKCEVCYKQGQKPIGEGNCCAGFYKNINGICVMDFPPLHETSIKLEYLKNKNRVKYIFNKIFSIIIPTAHAEEGISDKEFEEKKQECREKYSKEEQVDLKNECINKLLAQRRSTVREETSSLTVDEINSQHAEAKKNCFNLQPASRPACFHRVDEEKRALLKDRDEALGVGGTILTQEEYEKAFNRAVLVDKKGSDFKQCIFRSYNDIWNSSTNKVRNAHLVMRGFEYVYSGGGTLDYITDQNKKSVFERARAIALGFRQSRSAMIKRLIEIDHTMTEECKAIFSEFQDDNNSSNNDSGDSEDKEKNIAEIDKGASGVKYAQLMVRFLNLKKQAYLGNFARNAKLEEQMDELSTSLLEHEWPKAQKQERIKLYSYVEKKAGWLKWVVTIIGVSILAATGFGLIAGAAFYAIGGVIAAVGLVSILSSSFGQNADIQAHIRDQMLVAMYNNGEYKGYHEDVQTRGWHGAWTRKRNFDRYYVGFKSKMGDCEVHAASEMCYKNIHATLWDKKLRFFLDVKTPEFTNTNLFELDHQIVTKINKGHSRGLEALKATKPSKKVRKKWKRINFMDDSEIINKFLPGKNLNSSADFMPPNFDINDEERKKDIIKGILQYSTMLDLNPSSTIDTSAIREGCYSPDGKTKAKNASAGEYGFGLLVCSEKDVKAFAEYVYQHHYEWPSLSASNRMSYPSYGQVSYFQTLALNLKIIGSNSATQAVDFGELEGRFRDYLADLEGEYQAGSGAYQGAGSSNATYSSEFQQQFKLLDFQTGSGVDALIGSDGKAIVPKSFSSSERSVFEAGVNKAFRAKKAKEKADHYKKTVGDTPRGLAVIKAQKKHLNSFGGPLNSLSDNLKRGLSAADLAAANASKNKATEENTSKVATYKAPNIPKVDYSAFGTGYNANSYGSDSGESNNKDSSQRGLGLSQIAKNNSLIESANKMKADLERDDSDSIFKIVTKAYFRNLDLILERKSTEKKTLKPQENPLDFQKKEDTLSKDKKSELRDLLSQ